MLTITGLYAALLTLVILFLCYKVVAFRRINRVEIGNAGDAKGERLIRAQQNAVEYIPIALILMAAYELNNGNHLILHITGAALLFARIIHPWGFVSKKGANFGRFYGTLITWLLLFFLAGLNIGKFLKTAF